MDLNKTISPLQNATFKPGEYNTMETQNRTHTVNSRLFSSGRYRGRKLLSKPGRRGRCLRRKSKATSIQMIDTSRSEHLLTFSTTQKRMPTSLFEAIESKIWCTGSTPVSTASTKNSTACLSDTTVYAYLATQPNGSQVVHKDLDQIHEDDLDEMDLKWQLALLSIKARKFYQRTGKKIIINGSDTAGYDKKKEQKSRQLKKNSECGRSFSKAMLAIDGTGFDWSYMAQEEASTNFALMAFSDSEVQNNKTCSKTCLKEYLKTQYDKLRVELRKSESDLSNYKRGLASVEERLVFYKKNESILSDQIVVLKRDASFNESNINGLEKQVERLKKEKEENQFKIDNFKNASKSLEQLIANQISDNHKKGLGYNAFSPPLTGLFAPPSVDLSSLGIKKFKEPEFEGYGVKVDKGASENVSKEVKKTSDAPIIKDWVSNCDEDKTVVLESLNVQKPKQVDQPRKVSQNLRNNSTSWNIPKPKKLGIGSQFTPKACFVCESFNHLIKDCDFHNKNMVQKPVLNNVKKVTGQREVRLVWTNAMRVNHQKISNTRRNFAPTAVLTKSGLIPFSTARQSFSRKAAPVSAVRPFNTAVHKPFVNVAKPRTNVFQKAHSSLRRPFYQQTVLKNSNKVNTANVISVNTFAKNYKSNDPPLSKGYILGSGEDSLKLIELMDLCTKLIDKVTILENALKQSKESHAQTLTMLMNKYKQMTNLEFCDKHSIVNWEYILLGMTEAKDSEVCKITRADGTSSFHGDFQALLRRLDRQDLFQLYNLVQERFKHHPLEGHDLDLWGDLRMIFDPNEEDDIWLNQHYWELLRWKLHEYSGVHSLFLDGTSIQINMLVDKKYPLKKEILKKMINLKIEAEEESDMASELIKFIKSQIAEQS
ncbi:hypothetical protein Tco_0394704 [Tanacetum coccineum]